MPRKVYIEVVTKLIINMEDDIDVSDVVAEMDYNFKSQTVGADVIDSEIKDYTVIDSK